MKGGNCRDTKFRKGPLCVRKRGRGSRLTFPNKNRSICGKSVSIYFPNIFLLLCISRSPASVPLLPIGAFGQNLKSDTDRRERERDEKVFCPLGHCLNRERGKKKERGEERNLFSPFLLFYLVLWVGHTFEPPPPFPSPFHFSCGRPRCVGMGLQFDTKSQYRNRSTKGKKRKGEGGDCIAN